jgi:protein tyrosine/serine phosphatase
MTRRVVSVVAFTLACLAVASPVLFAVRESALRRKLRVVRPRVLYRSAQLPIEGLRRVIHDYRIRTVVNLRDGVQALDRAEEQYCASQGIRFVRIPPLSWKGTQGNAQVDEGLRRFLDVMRDPANHPVLVHCWRGIHRTGAYVAVYRMEIEGWDREAALAEMIDLGYDVLDEHHDVRGYLASYRPTARAGGEKPRRSP